ncbi:MAG: hypothetical protein ACRD0P_22155 [Stackebrandtia sp.]
MIYMQWRDGESRRGTIYTAFNPKIDMLAWTACRLCHRPLKAEQWQLLAVGPHPEYPAAIERHRAGLWYAATTTFAHARCVELMTDEELDHHCGTLTWGRRRAPV